MSEFDSSLIEACDILRDITEEKAQCIDEFVRSKQLIDWLKKSIKSKYKFVSNKNEINVRQLVINKLCF